MGAYVREEHERQRIRAGKGLLPVPLLSLVARDRQLRGWHDLRRYICAGKIDPIRRNHRERWKLRCFRDDDSSPGGRAQARPGSAR
jgi:hypothetical protein